MRAQAVCRDFYFKLKDLQLHNLLQFNFEKFADFLVRSKQLVGARYYVGRVRQDGSEHADKMLADQQKLLASLKKHKFQYSLLLIPIWPQPLKKLRGKGRS